MKIPPVAWLTTETVRKHRVLIIFTSKVLCQRFDSRRSSHHSECGWAEASNSSGPGHEPLPGPERGLGALRRLPGHTRRPGHQRGRHWDSRWDGLAGVHQQRQWSGMGRSDIRTFFFLQSLDFAAFWLQISITCGHVDMWTIIWSFYSVQKSGREDTSSIWLSFSVQMTLLWPQPSVFQVKAKKRGTHLVVYGGRWLLEIRSNGLTCRSSGRTWGSWHTEVSHWACLCVLNPIKHKYLFVPFLSSYSNNDICINRVKNITSSKEMLN